MKKYIVFFIMMIFAFISGVVLAGVTYAATGGQKETPEYLLRVGCTGTYFISPGMVQGQEAFRTYDKP